MASRLRFFFPDWEDRVDPGFNFQNDEFTPGRVTTQDAYAHEIFDLPPYDGILLSRAVIEKGRKGFDELIRRGAHEYLRLPNDLEVFGDCGAFSYVNDREPAYNTDEVLDYYEAIDVDYGVSVDHLVVDTIYDGDQKIQMDEDEKKRRVEITIQNANKFIQKHQKKNLSFTPVGVAQGWTPETYADSLRQLVDMGYAYIALGSLARTNANKILKVLKAVNETLDAMPAKKTDGVRFHLFGVAKINLLSELPKYRVASIDSASYLRKAWLRSGQNYLTKEGEWYSAIRVPQTDNPKLRKYIKENGKSLSDIKDLERFCLDGLQDYSNRKLSDDKLDDLVDAIIDYDSNLLRMGSDGQSFREKSVSWERYHRTLADRPWERCGCRICKDLGVHVLIFRGMNRNKRRGFHNTWVFHQLLQEA